MNERTAGGDSQKRLQPLSLRATCEHLNLDPARFRVGRGAKALRWGGDLDATLDEVRDRFGSEAVTRPAVIGRDRAWAMPLLPD
jgi:hypothetical protein